MTTHTTHQALRDLDDASLMQRLHQLIADDNTLEAELLTHIGEVDHRQLYREKAASSMFGYCVSELNLSESVAYKRIAVARAAAIEAPRASATHSPRIQLDFGLTNENERKYTPARRSAGASCLH